MEVQSCNLTAVADALAAVRSHQLTLQTRLKQLRSGRKLRESMTLAPPVYYANSHHPVACNQCRNPEIIGMRMKCVTCREFNLCEKCAAAGEHEHQLAEMPFEGKHYNIECDGCGQAPLEGLRHNCCLCGSFDLCHSCRMKVQHPHNAWKVLAPLNITANAYIHDSKDVCYGGDKVSITITVRNLSQMEVQYLSLVLEEGELPFAFHQDYAFRLSPGEANRFLIIGVVTKPAGRYNAALRVYLPEVSEATSSLIPLNFEVKARSVFHKVKSLFS